MMRHTPSTLIRFGRDIHHVVLIIILYSTFIVSVVSSVRIILQKQPISQQLLYYYIMVVEIFSIHSSHYYLSVAPLTIDTINFLARSYFVYNDNARVVYTVVATARVHYTEERKNYINVYCCNYY